MTIYTNARKDVNGSAVLCGISDSDGTVMPIQIDPVTNRVMIEIQYVSNNSPVLSDGWAQKDVNSVPTMLGQKDDASGLIVPGMYNVTQNLFVDLLME